MSVLLLPTDTFANYGFEIQCLPISLFLLLISSQAFTISNSVVTFKALHLLVLVMASEHYKLLNTICVTDPYHMYNMKT